MLYKNLPDDELTHVFRVRFWLDYLAALHFLLTGHPKNALAIYQARQAFFQLRPQYAGKRLENLKKAQGGQIPERIRASLIANFYLKGKKRFSELVKATV